MPMKVIGGGSVSGVATSAMIICRQTQERFLCSSRLKPVTIMRRRSYQGASLLLDTSIPHQVELPVSQ